MNILYGCVRYYPAIGGVERHVQTLAESLALRGHNLEILTSDLLQVGGTRIASADRADVGHVITRCRSYALPFPGFRRYPLLPRALSVLAHSRAEIWHAHAFWYWPADCMLLAAQLRGTPLVASPYFYPGGREHPLWAAYLRCMGSFLAQADVVTVLTHFEHEMLMTAGIAPRRVELVRPGVVPSQFDCVSHNVYERWHLAGRPIVLFVGRLSYEKGIDVLLHAAPEILKRVPDAAIVLAGPDFGERQRLELEVRRNRLGERIIFVGELSRADLLSAYKHAAVFAFPTRYEAFGIVSIEAMASGIPVVASRTTAIPEVVPDGEAGLLFPVDDARELAHMVVTLLRDDSLRRKLGARARALVEREFTFESQVDRLERIYASIS